MTNLSIKKRCAVDKTLLGLILLLVLINIPSFLKWTLPQHDTLFDFQVFYYFYNDLFFSGEIPRWLNFGFYGIQSDPSLIGNISASGGLSILIGLLFRVKSVIFLYSLALLLEQLILLVGSYLLARSLFKDTTTVIFVCIITIASSVILFQPYFNFRAYNYLPLIIYFIIKFFSTAKPRYLMLSGICFAVSFFGLAPYLIPIEALAITIIFAVLFCANLRQWRRFLSPSRGDLLLSGALFALFILVAGGYFYYVSNSMNFTEGLSTGRDPVTHMTELSAFLSYSPYTIGFNKFWGLIYPAPKYILSDITLYIGLISLAFVLYGIIFVRRAVFIAFAVTVVLFTLFSLGNRTPVAELLYYYFPMMKYYRHVGHTVGNFKVFLPFMAGFGLDHFLQRFAPATVPSGGADERSVKPGARTALFSLAVFSALILLGSFIYAKYIINISQGMAVGLSAVFLIVLFIVLRASTAQRRVSVFLLACILFQMLGYQVVVNSYFYQASARFREAGKEALMVNMYDFHNRRTLTAPEGRPAKTSPITNMAPSLYPPIYPKARMPLVSYTLAYNFLQWDPCYSAYRTDLLNTDVASLLRLKSGGRLVMTDRNLLILPYNKSLIQIIGCYAPKLKLSSNVLFTDTAEDSSDILRGSQDMSSLLVLSGVDEETRADWGTAERGDTDGDDGVITVESFSANELSMRVRVTKAKGSWLYYADAWHPGWRAFVNQRPTPIAHANIAFKAVKLNAGDNNVRFVFEKSPLRRLGSLLVAFELIFMSVFLAGTLFILFPFLALRGEDGVNYKDHREEDSALQ